MVNEEYHKKLRKLCFTHALEQNAWGAVFYFILEGRCSSYKYDTSISTESDSSQKYARCTSGICFSKI